VRIFSVSYNAHVLESSPHGHLSHIANNVYQTLINPRCKSPLFDCQNGMIGQMQWFHSQIYQATKIFRFKVCYSIIGSSLNCIENLYTYR